MKILLTEGDYKHTLGICRALGSEGYSVTVLAQSKRAPTAFSRFGKKVHIVDHSNEHEFIPYLLSLLQKERFDLLVPVGFPVVRWIVKHNSEIEKYTRTVLPSDEVITLLENKRLTQQLAESVGVAVPITVYPKSIADVQNYLNQLKYPVVIKGIQEIGGNLVDYAKNAEELLTKYPEVAAKCMEGEEMPMIQQYLTGVGTGFFALYDRGKCLQYFMHERIREYPTSGGASCCAKSIYDERILEYGKKILDTVQYNGVAMVEFKYDADRVPHLLEVNPKFWGSYDLSRAAGVNFPKNMVEIIEGKTVIHRNYKNGVVFSWPFHGDLLHGLERGIFFKILWEGLSGKAMTNLSDKDFRANCLIVMNGLAQIFRRMIRKV
jgi:predicted ATP-grasp superfamily ATP-dependent carboligase